MKADEYWEQQRIKEMTDDNLDDVNQAKFGCIKERINEKPRCKEQCDTCKYFKAEQAKLSVGKPVSELSVFEKEIRNKTLDDCIENMERAIELIRKMKT